ncbi:MAG: MATE family efflux transporter [Clostridiales bacterium]|nr:MATE family efflux transporter [Clostridiales bacterium]
MHIIGRNMTRGRPLRQILSLSLPLVLGNACQQVYTVANMAVVGNILGLRALATLGAVDAFNWAMLSFIQGLAQGFSIRIAHQYGACDFEGMKKTIGNSCSLAIMSAAALMAVGVSLIAPVLNLMNTPADIVGASRAYLQVAFLGAPAAMAYNLFAALLRAVGDGKTPLRAMFSAAAVNVALDLLFILAFRMGVEGAALATVVAQACAAGFCLRKLKRSGVLKLSRRDLAPDARLMAKLLGLGLPIALQSTVIGVGSMIVQRVINGFDVIFVAGFTATNKLYGVVEPAAISLGHALTAYVGQNRGAGAFDRIRRGVRASALAGALAAAVIGGIMLLFGRNVLSLFIGSGDAEASQALGYALNYLRLMSSFLPVLYLLHVYRSSLQGLGDTLTPMLSGFAELVMRVGAALLLPAVIGFEAVFVGEILAWFGADLILFWGYWARLRRFPA